MRRIRLIVSYDGTNYCGWQKQPNGITIEEVLNNPEDEQVIKRVREKVNTTMKDYPLFAY